MKASQAEPDADFWVGMERGIEVIDNQLMAFALMVVSGHSERASTDKS